MNEENDQDYGPEYEEQCPVNTEINLKCNVTGECQKEKCRWWKEQNDEH